jgi:tellurite resistance protein TehA-like permease
LEQLVLLASLVLVAPAVHVQVEDKPVKQHAMVFSIRVPPVGHVIMVSTAQVLHVLNWDIDNKLSPIILLSVLLVPHVSLVLAAQEALALVVDKPVKQRV